MAFTEEQEQNISATIARMAAYMDAQEKARADADAKAKAEAEAKEQAKPATLLDTAKEQVKTDAANAGNQSAIESALGFNMKIGDFAEKYKDVLPPTTGAILDAANKKTFSGAVEKADEIRKALIDGYLEIKENYDKMPASLKDRAARYMALTEEGKRKNSADFFDLVEIGAEMCFNEKRAAALQRANGGNGGGSTPAFRARFLALGDKYQRKG